MNEDHVTDGRNLHYSHTKCNTYLSSPGAFGYLWHMIAIAWRKWHSDSPTPLILTHQTGIMRVCSDLDD